MTWSASGQDRVAVDPCETDAHTTGSEVVVEQPPVSLLPGLHDTHWPSVLHELP
jgi:hypothetical protein